MEVGTEISQKIRSAIKAKLIELGAYVDDELPDYIMVMVANKKNQEQMISDLNLFLGKHTNVFAEWLHGLLGKLQTISVDTSAKNVKEKKKGDSKKVKVKKGSKKSSKGENSTAKTRAVASNDSSNNKSDEQTNENNSKASKSKESVEVEDVRQMLVTVAPTDELAAELETTEARIEQTKIATNRKTQISESKSDTRAAVSRKRSASPENERIQQSSASVPKKPKGLTSVVANVSVSKDVEEEYDPLCPAVGSVASVVKVTSRKSRIPPALQANRALLVKAMGEAERSIAIKRKTVIPATSISTSQREDSPSEVYTPKRKKSSGGEASPPPYIPSRKESATSSVRTSTTSSPAMSRLEHKDRGRHRKDARHILSARDRTDLISRSRRMELFRKMGIDRQEKPISSARYLDEPRRIETGERDRLKKVVATTAAKSTKDLSSDRKTSSSEVRDLKITARLGPAVVRSTTGESSRTSQAGKVEREGLIKSTRTTYSKENTLQVIINPVASPALKGSVASRLGKMVVSSTEKNAQGDSVKVIDLRDKMMTKGQGERRKLATVTSHAKSLVNKQCREAVMSMGLDQGRVGRRARSASPDSRVVETENSPPTDRSEEEEEEVQDDTEALIERKRSVSASPTRSSKKAGSVEASNPVHADREEKEKGEENEELDHEDLADMIGEDLEPELLNDTVPQELNLDLEEETEDADDIETLIGVKTEEDKPKAGTRFIVTLDGVDEALFEGEVSESGKNLNPLPPPFPFIQPSINNVPSRPAVIPFSHPKMSPLSPPLHVLPLQPALLPPAPVPAFSIGAPLPLPSVKPLPPKIQPFSISLKDSDDEVEDKDSRRQLPSSSSGYIPVVPSATESLTALRKAKMSERCKFWPACAAGSECEFYHPTSYCKTFPNCKFMDKCLFIHPNCKFDSKCTRPDCPFTHTSRRLGLGGAPTAIPPPPAPMTNTVCRFFPGCHNPSCGFLHPKPCRFGAACQNPGCGFYHPLPAPTTVPAVPTKNKLKWKAPMVSTFKESSVSLKLPVPDPTAKFHQPVAKVSPMSSNS